MLIRTQTGHYVHGETIGQYLVRGYEHLGPNGEARFRVEAEYPHAADGRESCLYLGEYETPDSAQSALDALVVALILAEDRIGWGYYDMAEGAFVKVGEREIKTTC